MKAREEKKGELEGGRRTWREGWRKKGDSGREGNKEREEKLNGKKKNEGRRKRKNMREREKGTAGAREKEGEEWREQGRVRQET